MKKILNIMLGILMVITAVLLVYAIATGGSDAAISANLMWSYFLHIVYQRVDLRNEDVYQRQM